jgi:hypothetical protein
MESLYLSHGIHCGVRFGREARSERVSSQKETPSMWIHVKGEDYLFFFLFDARGKSWDISVQNQRLVIGRQVLEGKDSQWPFNVKLARP